eukprot:sb/3470245/
MAQHKALVQASNGDPSHKICIFGPQYCYPHQFQLLLKEKFFKLRDDCFKIQDTAGNTFFQVSNPWASLRSKHVLKDVYGNDICKIKKKLWAFRYTWHMLADTLLFTRSAMFMCTSLPSHTRTIQLKLGRHLQPLLMMKSSVFGFDIKIYDGQNQDVLYAHMSKDAFRDILLSHGDDSYCLTIEPGVDVAFMTSLALMWDYAISDMQKNN